VGLGVGHGMWEETSFHQVPSIRSKESQDRPVEGS
jgi:hypothetical protein